MIKKIMFIILLCFYSLLFAVTLKNAKSQIKTQLVPRAQFFKDIVGLDEGSFRALKTADEHKNILRCEEKSGSKTYFIKNQETGYEYQAGFFEEFSIAQLRGLTAHIDARSIDEIKEAERGRFSAVDGSLLEDKKKVDIGALQADPANNDVVLQGASNFNGLETVNAEQIVDTQLLGSYIYDNTQGPGASISAAPGVIFRHYYRFYDPSEKDALKWRQSSIEQDQDKALKQINFLSEVEPAIKMSRAGYVQLADALDPEEKDDASLKRIKIGYHGGIEVSHGYKHDKKMHEKVVSVEPKQFVNQVFTAAVDLGGTNVLTPTTEKWAQLILKAAYEGTIRIAAFKGKKRVILTLIGGGVFKNKFMWIYEAIASMKDFVIKAGLEVIIIGYGGFFNNAYPELGNITSEIKTLVKETGGTYNEVAVP